MGLFMSKEQRAEKDALRELKKAADPDYIKKCAAQSPYVNVRLAAIERINDTLFLCALAVKIDHDGIRRAAVKRLPEAHLTALCEQAEAPALSHMCMEQLGALGRSDLQETLIRKDVAKAYGWINTVSDPDVLLRLYRDGIEQERIYDHICANFPSRATPEMKLNEASLPQAAFDAIEKTNDQMLLAKRLCITRLTESMEEKVDEMILSRLTEPEALRYAALHYTKSGASKCLQRLGENCFDDTAFRDQALHARYKYAARDAICTLNEKQLYFVIVMAGRVNSECREDALRLMRDRELLKKLALSCDDARLSMRASVASGDEALMGRALAKCDDFHLPDVLEFVLDFETLGRIACDEPKPARLREYLKRLCYSSVEDSVNRVKEHYIRSLENDRDGWMKAYLAYMNQPRSRALDTTLAAHMTRGVTDKLEALLGEGNAAAGAALMRLYQAKDLNPALMGHAVAQQQRIQKEHMDKMVDSTVCGETFRHEDGIVNETISPL